MVQIRDQQNPTEDDMQKAIRQLEQQVTELQTGLKMRPNITNSQVDADQMLKENGNLKKQIKEARRINPGFRPQYTSNRQKMKTTNDKSSITCFNCHKKGRYASVCRAPKVSKGKTLAILPPPTNPTNKKTNSTADEDTL
jgi:hypothetical protein